MIFIMPVNEEESDGILIEENLEDTSALDQSSREVSLGTSRMIEVIKYFQRLVQDTRVTSL